MHVDEVTALLFKYRIDEDIELKPKFKERLKEEHNLIEEEDFLFFRDKTGWYCRKTLTDLGNICDRGTISVYSFGEQTEVLAFADAVLSDKSQRKYIDKSVADSFQN